MSLKITRDLSKRVYVIKPVGIKAVTTDSLDEVAVAIAHYFGEKKDKARHEIFKKKGLCPLCEVIKLEDEGSRTLGDTET